MHNFMELVMIYSSDLKKPYFADVQSMQMFNAECSVSPQTLLDMESEHQKVFEEVSL